jgi:alpha-L-fucosidase
MKHIPARFSPGAGSAAILLATLASAFGGNACVAEPSQAVDYAPMQVIAPEDTAQTIVEKAAKVLPRPNQTNWMRMERTFFIHFGMNTFNGVEWGSGREDPAIFNPASLDARQWIGAVKNAGGRMVILVSKHHDGFCMWPTRYTNHSVTSSPWLNGKGDLVKAVSDAAREEKIKLGIYLSPADLYQLRTNPVNPSGYYGNGSKRILSTIPTDPASFKSDPSKGREPTPGFGSFSYEVDDYNRYFLNQLYELLTEYGPISVVWFDGANPDPSVQESYDYAAWYDLIRKLQPGAVISVKGPDSRWVGNEGGVGRLTEWSVIPLPESPSVFKWPDMYGADLGGRTKLVPGSHLWWYPAEVNTSILEGWFWAPGKRVKSSAELIDFYYTSVGRNGNMLLNLPPDTRGLIPDDQLASLNLMAQVVNDTFARNLAEGGILTADSSAPQNDPALATDGDPDTWWEAAPGHSSGTLTLTLSHKVTFDVVSLQEAVDHRGQRIESFVVEVWNGSAWTAVDTQTTVGHKRLLRLNSPAATDKIRIRITGSRSEPTIAELGLFKQAMPLPPPRISDRSIDGTVTLDASGRTLVYTVDGSAPTPNSSVYRSPIPLPTGGTVQAAVLSEERRVGLISSRYFAGLSPAGWEVVAVDGVTFADRAASAAIDSNPSTHWIGATVPGDPSPCRITIDMGSLHRIRGFAYLPRRDGSIDGVVETYRFESSVDGVKWTTNVESGRFGNIRNNPVLQEVTFTPVDARFFRFTMLKELGDKGRMSIAEISVLPAVTASRQ